MKETNAISARMTKMLLGLVAPAILLATVGASLHGRGAVRLRGRLLLTEWSPRSPVPISFSTANLLVSKLPARTAIQIRALPLFFSKLLLGAWFPRTITPQKNN